MGLAWIDLLCVVHATRPPDFVISKCTRKVHIRVFHKLDFHTLLWPSGKSGSCILDQEETMPCWYGSSTRPPFEYLDTDPKVVMLLRVRRLQDFNILAVFEIFY